MNFLKKMFSSRPDTSSKKYYIFQVKCRRCGEIIEGRVDLEHNLSAEYEDDSEVYSCRKVLMGDGKNPSRSEVGIIPCYQQVEVGLKFDANRKLLERRIEAGGDFVEE